LKRERSLEALL
jgi:hypothetical protein